MSSPEPMRFFGLLLAAAVFGLPATSRADETPTSQFTARYPKGSIATVEAAERALNDAEQARAAADAQLGAEERECYEKFFATSCLDKAKDRHHNEMTAIRQVELEASAFKRRARVDEREREMQEREAKRAAEPPVAADRVQRHEEKMKMLQEQDARQEQERRSNIAAFEQKQRDAEQRQRDAAKRKAEGE